MTAINLNWENLVGSQLPISNKKNEKSIVWRIGSNIFNFENTRVEMYRKDDMQFRKRQKLTVLTVLGLQLKIVRKTYWYYKLNC